MTRAQSDTQPKRFRCSTLEVQYFSSFNKYQQLISQWCEELAHKSVNYRAKVHAWMGYTLRKPVLAAGYTKCNRYDSNIGPL